jgi:hypothetical protein
MEVPASPRPTREWLAPLLIGIASGIGAIALGAAYNGLLFMLTPFLIGVGAAWIPQTPSCTRSAASGAFATVISCLVFLLIGAEGLLCLIMAVPIAVPIGTVGGALGGLLRARWSRPPVITLVVLGALLPLGISWRGAPPHPSTPTAITTAIDIPASPQAVWDALVAFPPITARPTGILAWGIAYPTHAVLREADGHRIRECHFTTGPFIEPITTWDPPRLMAFDVAAQPDPMRELSPWDIHPPHLDTVLRSHRGALLLEPLPGGGTRLSGTTWYTLGVEPAWYWRWWTEPILHAVHRRVLEHVAAVAIR